MLEMVRYKGNDDAVAGEVDDGSNSWTTTAAVVLNRGRQSCGGRGG